jgi:hypothetical protein
VKILKLALRQTPIEEAIFRTRFGTYAFLAVCIAALAAALAELGVL